MKINTFEYKERWFAFCPSFSNEYLWIVPTYIASSKNSIAHNNNFLKTAKSKQIHSLDCSGPLGCSYSFGYIQQRKGQMNSFLSL